MNTLSGYSKKTLTDSKLLLAAGGDMSLSSLVGSVSWDSTNKKIQYTPYGGTAIDVVTLQWSNIKNAPQSLPANGGNADTTDNFHFTTWGFPYLKASTAKTTTTLKTLYVTILLSAYSAWNSLGIRCSYNNAWHNLRIYKLGFADGVMVIPENLNGGVFTQICYDSVYHSTTHKATLYLQLKPILDSTTSHSSPSSEATVYVYGLETATISISQTAPTLTNGKSWSTIGTSVLITNTIDTLISWSNVISKPNLVNTVGGQAGAITVRGGLTANGSVNLTMSGKEIQASIVGLGSNAYSSTSYLPLSGTGDSTNGTDPTSVMKGPVWFKNVDGIKINSNNTDRKIWEVVGNSGSYARLFGFHLEYKGTASNNDKDLILWAHNRTGTYAEVYRVHLDGSFIFKSLPKVGSDNIALAKNYGTAATHAHTDYVTSIGTSGNTLTWSKGGTALTAITVPYATNSGTVGGKSASEFLYTNRLTNTVPSHNYIGTTSLLAAVLGRVGYPLFTDPEFASGNNSCIFYSRGVATGSAEVINDNQHSGNSSGKILKITTTSTENKNWSGGFYQVLTAADSKIKVQIFRAKLPSGYLLTEAANPQGTGAYNYWLTSNIGTGKWEWYIFVWCNGYDGTFSTGGHFSLSKSGACTGTEVWYVSYANIYDITNGSYDGLRTRYADSATNADTLDGIHANGLFTNFSNAGTLTTKITIGGTEKTLKIDADLVDGLHVHTGRNNEANKIVRTDAYGYLQAGWINTTSGDMSTTAATRVYCSDDGYIRYKTLANFSADVAGQLYWANVKVSTSSNDATSPTFGNFYGKLTARDNTATNALLHSGSGRPDSATGDTWIFVDSAGGYSSVWGIKHNLPNNYIEYYGNGTLRAYINLNDNPSFFHGIDSDRTIKSTYAGPAFLAQVSSGLWACMRLHNSSNYWDLATNNSSSYGSGRLELRYNGSDSAKAGVNTDGTLFSTALGNTVTIGSANSSYMHFLNSTDIPFWFNKRVEVDGAIWRYNTSYGIDSDGYFHAKGVYANRDGSQTLGGVSLYSNSDPMTYGVAFRGTGTYGTHGKVTSDWATYFTMNNYTTRGWIFRRNTTNIASISGAGDLTLNRNIYLLRNLGDSNGYISYYSPSHYTWITYMNNGGAVSPTSKNSPSYGNVTSWAMRSLIENASGYGWILESCTNANTSTPDVKFAVSASVGNAMIKNSLSANDLRFNKNLAYYNTQTSTVTGIIEISLPNSWTNTMANYEIVVYEYNNTNGGSKILVSGYNYAGVPAWIHYRVAALGNFTKKVRLARNTSTGKCCILLGETNTAWILPLVWLNAVYTGYYNQTIWYTGYSISAGITTEANYEKIVTPSRLDAVYATNAEYATKLNISKSTTLDTNSTDFYVDYAVEGNTVATKPTGVDAFGCMHLRTADDWCGEILLSSNKATGLYYRTATSLTSSTSWVTLLDSKNSSVSGKTITINGTSTTWANNAHTTFKWTDGTSAGPTGSLSGNDHTAVTFPAIPSASAFISGIVTTGALTFAGAKTFKEVVHLRANQYTDSAGTGSLNLNNSDIYGVNSIKFADFSDSAAEGLQWYRDSTHVDSLWVQNGVIYFTPNREWGKTGTNHTLIHSGNYTTYCAPASHTHSEYLYTTLVNAALGNITWAQGVAETNRRAFIYNESGAEYSYLFGFSNSNTSAGKVASGAVLKMGYADKYLRILRVSGGNWQTTDWEKISAGKADSWTTARTITLSTDASGSISIDGSANKTLVVTNTRLSSNYSTTSSDPGGLTWFDIDGTAGCAVNTNDTPTSAWWYILRNRHINTSNNYYTDIAIPFNNTSIYYKIVRDGTFPSKYNKWVKVLDVNNSSVSGGGSSAGDAITVNIGETSKTLTIPSTYAWSLITGKPSTFTPASHTHSYLPLSGGTVTGQTVITKDLGYEIKDWTTALHSGPFEVGRATNTWRVTIGVTDDDIGYIQSKALNISSPGFLVLNPCGDYTKTVSGTSRTGSVGINLKRVPYYSLEVNGTLGISGATTLSSTLSVSSSSSFSGHAIFNGGTANGYSRGAIEIQGDGKNNTIYPILGFHLPGKYAGYIRLAGWGQFEFVDPGYGKANLISKTFTSNIVTGTAPFTITSTTKVDNLNADLLDDKHASDFATSGHNHDAAYVSALGTNGNYLTWTKNGTTNSITIPYATNADKLDGYHYNDFRSIDKHTILVAGDKDTFYPVFISTGNKRYCTTISIWRNLGDRSAVWPGSHNSYLGTNGGGTSCWYMYLWRNNVWDGNLSWATTIMRLSDYISNHICHVGNCDSGSQGANGRMVVWLRGGNTQYHIDADDYINIDGPYYSNTTFGVSYPYTVNIKTESTAGNNFGLLDGNTWQIRVRYASSAGNADTTDNVHIEWSGSLAASATNYVTVWTNDGTKLKAAPISGFALSGHTHSQYLPLSGGTMTNGALIRWEDAGQWGAANPTYPHTNGGLYWSGTSDTVKLYTEETRGDNLELIIQFGDDNSNGLSIRNSSNVDTARITALGYIYGKQFHHNDYDNNDAVLLAGGGYKLISDFATSGHTHSWSLITSKPTLPTFVCHAGALNSGGWKTLNGRSNGSIISVAYNNNPAAWNSSTYSASLVWGCSDTRGLLDCSYGSPTVTFGGGSVAGSTDDAPKWYFKITATANTTYDLDTIKSVTNKAVTLAWNTSTTIATIGNTDITVKLPANPNTWRGITDSYDKTDASISLSQKGANALYSALLNGYASSAGNADTVDGKHASYFATSDHTHSYSDVGAASASHTHTTIVGSYTSNGGLQGPGYFGKNRVGALMMNTTINRNSLYKDFLFMDCYSNTDVGGGVAIGVNRQSLGAYIMRSDKDRAAWVESAELIGTHNYEDYCATASHTHTYSEVGAAAASHTHYWANISTSSSSSTATEPLFGKIGVGTTINKNDDYTITTNGTVYTSAGFKSGNVLFTHNGSYIELACGGNEMVISGHEKDMYVNYRKSAVYEKGIPINWYWNAGSSESYANHYSGHYYERSDIRLKTNLELLTISSKELSNIPLFDFDWVNQNTGRNTGTSALAVLAILPNLVSGEDTLHLDYGVLGTIAGVTACKELVSLREIIEKQQEEINTLKDKISELENKLNKQ